MRRAVLSFIFLVTAYTVFSQRIYFIYLQTESGQPFFVKLDEKLYSSTASGYLILPKLKDSTYNFTIGFPGNQVAEQKFNCTINKKDHGYIIKNFGEKGWGLYDLQTSSVQMSSNANNKNGVSVSNTPVNAFTELLAKAEDDSTLKRKITLQEEKKKTGAVAKATEKKVDSALNVIPIQLVDSAKKPEVAENAIAKQSGSNGKRADEVVKPVIDSASKQEEVVKENEKVQLTIADTNNTAKTTEAKAKQDSQSVSTVSDSGFVRSKIIQTEDTGKDGQRTYVDMQQAGKQDTIKIIIPDDESKVQSASNPKEKDTTANKKNSETIQSDSAIVAKTVSKNKCKQIASDADFYKLRKKMTDEKSDDAMLADANRLFKVKCLTTSQVKRLSYLFLGDGGKYNFFDVAYQHVSDAENFPALQSELKDEYFINRFKAILK